MSDHRKSPAQPVQTAIAIHIAKTMKIIREIAPQLPTDVIVNISTFGIGEIIPENAECCSCNKRRRQKDTSELNLAWVNCQSFQTGVAVCSNCWKAGYAVVRPRMPRQKQHSTVASSYPISACISVQPLWMVNRHFQMNPNTTVATRHRMSGFHSFRTVLCNQWVTSGSVSYILQFKLSYPHSFGVGIVTPEATVNLDTGWCAGTKGWKHAWGLCVEGRRSGTVERYNEMRAIEESIVFDGGIPEQGGENSDESARVIENAKTFKVTIDASRRTLKIEKIQSATEPSIDPTKSTVLSLCLAEEEKNDSATKSNRPGIDDISQTISQACSAVSGSQEQRPPLSLAVALKFAGDEVTIRRLDNCSLNM
eukprot:CAMPEP_0194451008 /NCGR_PEP_ID=MMETSP0176-20130528/131059_1 /TAXON_ID=216777 /ORGANISM="Proboscia alata, Strain PI-D3" /LENGTH=365 /DNA_ID=CAMNT_0039278393 /DNA_START=29 /DNA_END=1126 /DNA_ORIENTATION=-